MTQSCDDSIPNFWSVTDSLPGLYMLMLEGVVFSWLTLLFDCVSFVLPLNSWHAWLCSRQLLNLLYGMDICQFQLWTVQKNSWRNRQVWRWSGGVFSWLRKIWFHSQVVLYAHLVVCFYLLCLECRSVHLVHITLSWVISLLASTILFSFFEKERKKKLLLLLFPLSTRINKNIMR